MHTLAFLHMPGGWEWLIILGIGLLLFGKRLPDVGRSLGRSIVEFKRGVRDIQSEIDSEAAPGPARTGTEKSALPGTQPNVFAQGARAGQASAPPESAS